MPTLATLPADMWLTTQTHLRHRIRMLHRDHRRHLEERQLRGVRHDALVGDVLSRPSAAAAVITTVSRTIA